ncbi:MAG: O-acetylhomoserine/O-acetylserine sulfhydrylase-like pyridoxal-dependent enzyme, partial [Limisphaerales bacterium]
MASKFSAFKKGRAPKIAILGSLALDTNNRGSHSKKMYGGAVTYCGLTLAKLGAEVFVFSSSKNKHCPVLKQHTKLQFIESETDTEFINTEFENGSRDQKVSSISAPIPIAILEALSE